MPIIKKLAIFAAALGCIASIDTLESWQSGRIRQSDNGNTIGFINNTEMTVGGALSAPTELMGQNNGFKVELKWSDTNSGKIGYAAQVGTAADNFDLSRGNLNASGYPLFPDRFESF